MSTVTVAERKFNTDFELNVQDVLRMIIYIFVLDIIIIIIIIAGTCEYGKEPSGSIKCGEFLG
jgi:hypothetical protein